jgi:hypothetical protein
LSTGSPPNPWSLPVPLRRSRFTSLHAAHADYAVEVDLGAIAPFALAPTADGDALVGWVDLQAGGLLRRRLGSGRACTFRGKYVKGVGRTQLAANWRDPGDAYHQSGHLLPSGALREYVVSRHLERKGLAHTIVPCEGVLIAPLAEPLRNFHARAFAELAARGATPLPVDTQLQALSVKPGGFTRFSHLLRLAAECATARDIAPLFVALASALELGDDAATPAALAEALAAAIARGMTHFGDFLRAGVFWGSFHNNFTLDGRFVDLELPSMFGAPFVGHQVELWPDGSRSQPLPIVPGCELLVFLEETRRFVIQLQHSLACFVALDLGADATAREFVAEFVAALDVALPSDHPVRDGSAARRATYALLCATFAPEPPARQALQSLVEGCQDRLLGRRRDPVVLDDDWRELPLRPAPRETMLAQAFYWPRFLAAPSFAEGQAIAARLHALDATTDRDRLLTLLQQV